MLVSEAFKFAEAELNQSADNSISANIDSRYLLSFVMKKNFTWLKTWPNEELSAPQQQQFLEVINRRKKGEPIAYITGEKDFWSLTLKTNALTLIPRPETELLVEQAIEFLSNNNFNGQSANILDLGTGTGAIALSIAKERPGDNIIASDFSIDIVKLAEQNAQINQLRNVQVIQSDWFNNIPANNFDLIVSNPPYVEENDPHLLQGDLIFEPHSALVAKEKGLSDIKQIIQQAKSFIKSGGALMIEHGYDQAERIKKIYSDNDYDQVTTIKDLSGQDRITIGVHSC